MGPAVSQSTWYQVEPSDSPYVQIVLDIPSGESLEPRFHDLLLPFDYFPELCLTDWGAGLFDTTDHDGPFLMIRANEGFEGFREVPLSIGFTFFMHDSGGAVSMFVGPSDKQGSPKRRVVEAFTLLDSYTPNAVDRIRRLFDKEILHICVMGNGASEVEIINIGQAPVRKKSPGGKFDRMCALDPEVRSTLIDRFEELRARHIGIPKERRSWERCLDAYNAIFTSDRFPILPKPAIAEPSARTVDGRFLLRGTTAEWGSGHTKDFEYLGIGRPWVLDNWVVELEREPDLSSLEDLFARYKREVEAFIRQALRERGLGSDFVSKHSAELEKEVLLTIIAKINLSYAVQHNVSFEVASNKLTGAFF